MSLGYDSAKVHVCLEATEDIIGVPRLHYTMVEVFGSQILSGLV